jgi:hypothetical protein
MILHHMFRNDLTAEGAEGAEKEKREMNTGRYQRI